MIISVNWLKQLTDIDVPVAELATLIGARLVEIEEVIDLGAKYKDVVVAKVVTSEKLEGSDHLNVTRLDDGGVTLDIERDENGLIQVVCGAPNVRAGILVAWLPPGSTVPETYGEAEPFVLGSRKLRGVISNGMIASSRELALTDEHDGIVEGRSGRRTRCRGLVVGEQQVGRGESHGSQRQGRAQELTTTECHTCSPHAHRMCRPMLAVRHTGGPCRKSLGSL